MGKIAKYKIEGVKRRGAGEESWDLCPYGRGDQACREEN